jgi:lipoprotein-anchoring transpeptidase ErfK/SrfK
MMLRFGSAIASLALLVLSSGGAAAQFYPPPLPPAPVPHPGALPPSAAPGPYAVPADDYDETPGYERRRSGSFAARPVEVQPLPADPRYERQAAPYQSAPAQAAPYQAEPQPLGPEPRYERQAAPYPGEPQPIAPEQRYERQAAPYPADPRYERQASPYPGEPQRFPAEPQRSPYDQNYERQAAPSPLPPPFINDPGRHTIHSARPEETLRPPAAVGPGPNSSTEVTGARGNGGHYASLPPEYRPEDGKSKELPAQFRRQLVNFQTKEPAGTLIVDTPNTYLYLVMGNGQAMRYGIGVGREGFTWTGTERISRRAEWPDWHPPSEMIERQPYLPRFMAGGPGNPLGARALYLGKTLYRIHGTNQPSTIGTFVSSGCIRLVNDDIEDLYTRVNVGTRVVVWPGKAPASPAATASAPLPPAGLAPATASVR